jgi:hypothetical protein
LLSTSISSSSRATNDAMSVSSPARVVVGVVVGVVVIVVIRVKIKQSIACNRLLARLGADDLDACQR